MWPAHELTRMTLSRVHTSAEAADITKLLLLIKRRITHSPVWSMMMPHLTVTITLA